MADNPGPTVGSGSSRTDELARRFRERTLSKAEWTHAAHLLVGLWHVLCFPAVEALERLRAGNTDTGGYHETITRFYDLWIGDFANRAGRERPVDELADEIVAAAGDRKLPLQYYSRERLFTVAARQGWVAPDLAPIPSPDEPRYLGKPGTAR